jgi:putative effector of murein hydrolase LrgA (UPF0299 family)
MAVYTTKNSAIFCNGQRLGKVTTCNLDLSQELMEDTTIEKYHKTFVPGSKTGTASMTLLYDPLDVATINILESIINNSYPVIIMIALSTVTNKSLTFTAFVTQASIPVAVQQAVAISLNLQITGSVSGIL